jgi:hypothetical protein
MTLFDPPVSPRLLWPIDAPWPKRRAKTLLKRFQTHFPELTYDMDLGVELANAQAFLDGAKKRVRLFGGLVRHRKIGLAGLAFTLGHETGHHLGGAPYLQFHRWLSSEERATEWAINICLPRVFGNLHASSISREGRRQLATIGMVE